ncbi:MAG: PorP/SprF family type IX secretion system membrane protein, partial [Paludibacteraceae bacterium]
MNTTKYIITAVLAILGVSLSNNAEAQDMTLSQPYSSSLYLAPSFAGMSNGGKSFLTYRNQWPGLSGGYNSVIFGCDYFFRRQSSSLGVLLSYDNQAGIFSTLEFKPQYNYRIELSRGLYFRPGIELSAYYKSIKTDNLVFADQIAVDGSILDKNEIERLDQTGGLKIDAAISALVYNNDFWVGAALHHLTQTDVSFVGNESKTPIKISALGGFRYVYDRNWQRGLEDALTATLLLQHQSNYSQMHIGIFWHKMPLELGIAYRDLP